MDYSSTLSQLLFSKTQGALDLSKGLVNAECCLLVDSNFSKVKLVQKLTTYAIEIFINAKDPSE